MEITQYTYFQQAGGFEVKPVAAELTYGLERIAMYLQDVENVFDVEWVKGVKYREVFHRNEVEMSEYSLPRRATRRCSSASSTPTRRSAKRLHRARAAAAGLRLLPEVLPHLQHASTRAAPSASPSGPPTSAGSGRWRTSAPRATSASREALGFPLLPARGAQGGGRGGARGRGRESGPSAAGSSEAGQGGQADLLFEIGAEEIPAGFVAGGAAAARRRTWRRRSTTRGSPTAR